MKWLTMLATVGMLSAKHLMLVLLAELEQIIELTFLKSDEFFSIFLSLNVPML